MAELAVRVVVSLGVVLGLFWLIARSGSRTLGGRDRGLVTMRTRHGLSRGASLAVVEVGSRVLVLGVSDAGVRLLTELDPAELTSPRRASQDLDPQVAAVAGEEVLVADGSVTLEGAAARAGHDQRLSGSLLDGDVWRQAWVTAVSRRYHEPGGSS